MLDIKFVIKMNEILQHARKGGEGIRDLTAIQKAKQKRKLLLLVTGGKRKKSGLLLR